MAASSVFALGLVMFAATVCPAQSSSSQSSAPQSSSQGASSGSHRSVHHIQVLDDDAPSQPAELTQAEAAIEKQNYAAAEALLRKLVARDSSSYVGWFDLGFVENALGHIEESIAAYRKSVAAKPDVFETNLNLGLQLAKTGQPDAETFLRDATRLKPTSHAAEGQYRAWLALGHAIESAKPDEALSAYQQAATLQPKEAEPHLVAGQLLEKENEFADAEREYKEALALDARSTDAVIGLANIYMRGRKFSEAEEYLRKLLASESDVQSAAVHIQLGRVLAADGKTDDAIAELQQGIKLAPGDDAAQRDLADLYSGAGKNDLAETAFRGLIALHPNEAELHRRLGQALLRQRKFSEAEREFATGLKLNPALAEAYGDLAFAASERGDYALVIRALDARVKFLPEIPITYFLRASAYDHLHDVKKAEVNYRLFLKTASGKYPDQEWQATHRLNALEPKR
jgi:tetratricopeptide (TPR) repeat protein